MNNKQYTILRDIAIAMGKKIVVEEMGCSDITVEDYEKWDGKKSVLWNDEEKTVTFNGANFPKNNCQEG